MSAKEYLEWKADYSIRPWGEELQDYRIGMVTQSIRAANSKDAILMKDCMPVFKFVQEKKEFNWEAASANLRRRTIALGGKVG